MMLEQYLFPTAWHNWGLITLILGMLSARRFIRAVSLSRAGTAAIKAGAKGLSASSGPETSLERVFRVGGGSVEAVTANFKRNFRWGFRLALMTILALLVTVITLIKEYT